MQIAAKTVATVHLSLAGAFVFPQHRIGTKLEVKAGKVMELTPLNDAATLEEIATASEYRVIFKHNTTCPISQGVLARLESEQKMIPGVQAVYLLDLFAHRDLSNDIAGRFGVPHQSPQVLLIKDGRCQYHEWGFDITAEGVAGAVEKG